MKPLAPVSFLTCSYPNTAREGKMNEMLLKHNIWSEMFYKDYLLLSAVGFTPSFHPKNLGNTSSCCIRLCMKAQRLLVFPQEKKEKTLWRNENRCQFSSAPMTLPAVSSRCCGSSQLKASRVSVPWCSSQDIITKNFPSSWGSVVTPELVFREAAKLRISKFPVGNWNWNLDVEHTTHTQSTNPDP